MGRRRKYFTDEQIKEASSMKAKSFYEENKSHLASKSKEKYWIKKIKLLKEQGDTIKVYKAMEKAQKSGVIVDLEDL